MYARRRAHETEVRKLSNLIKKRNNARRRLLSHENGLSNLIKQPSSVEERLCAIQRIGELRQKLWNADGQIVKFAESMGRHF